MSATSEAVVLLTTKTEELLNSVQTVVDNTLASRDTLDTAVGVIMTAKASLDRFYQGVYTEMPNARPDGSLRQAGDRAYVNGVVAGTPGTWKTFGTIAA